MNWLKVEKLLELVKLVSVSFHNEYKKIFAVDKHFIAPVSDHAFFNEFLALFKNKPLQRSHRELRELRRESLNGRQR